MLTQNSADRCHRGDVFASMVNAGKPLGYSMITGVQIKEQKWSAHVPAVQVVCSSSSWKMCVIKQFCQHSKHLVAMVQWHSSHSSWDSIISYGKYRWKRWQHLWITTWSGCSVKGDALWLPSLHTNNTTSNPPPPQHAFCRKTVHSKAVCQLCRAQSRLAMWILPEATRHCQANLVIPARKDRKTHSDQEEKPPMERSNC